ncbi:MAG: hypothetical protein U0T83_03605 [Bacteriovoracaceae bacterium]
MAIVKSNDTIIYSDQECKIPIGRVAKGKLVKVGDVARARGTVLPIVVSGKITYIKVDDLYISNELQKIDNPRFVEDEEYVNTLKEYNQNLKKAISFHVGRFDPGHNYEQFLQDYNVRAENKYGNQYDLTFEAPVSANFQLTLGGYFIQLNNPYVSKSNFGLKFGPQWHVYYINDVLIDLNVSALITKNYKHFQDETIFGIKPSLFLTYFWDKNWGVRFGAGMLYQKSTNKYKEDVSYPNSPYLLGGQAFIGLIFSMK